MKKLRQQEKMLDSLRAELARQEESLFKLNQSKISHSKVENTMSITYVSSEGT